jgi:hypothetical protein
MMTSDLHLVTKLRIPGAISFPLPHDLHAVVINSAQGQMFFYVLYIQK